jgi:hypothetical protein
MSSIILDSAIELRSKVRNLRRRGEFVYDLKGLLVFTGSILPGFPEIIPNKGLSNNRSWLDSEIIFLQRFTTFSCLG